MGEIIGQWRKWHNEGLNNLQSLLNIRMVKVGKDEMDKAHSIHEKGGNTRFW
jgi:hypothetical protein